MDSGINVGIGILILGLFTGDTFDQISDFLESTQKFAQSSLCFGHLLNVQSIFSNVVFFSECPIFKGGYVC